MSVEEVTEAPNWLAKLEEQRERRLKAKLGHEAGAGAPCQNCGDKCPGLDLHFWRKICKLCKCGKEDHDISDDDIYGFVQFQLLGNKPTKAKSIFLDGKEDAITLDWTPKGSNNDVKKYLEGLPEELLPVKGSEAARLRKQRLQKQLPAHDIDASLCHALTPEEIQQLEEYVAHIRNHSVGQGKIIQIPILRGEQHKFGAANSQFINQQISGQVNTTQNVILQPANIAQNLQNLSLRDKPINNRAAFLNSQLPNAANINIIDEQNPEFIKYTDKIVNPNYVQKNLHQTVDSQNPTTIGKINDINYSAYKNLPRPEHLMSEKIIAQNPVTGETYYTQNPEYSKLVNNPHSSEQYSRQNPNYTNKYAQNPYDENKYKIPHPNSNTVHGTQNLHLPHNAQVLSKNAQENIDVLNPNIPQNLDTQKWAPQNFERVPFLEHNAYSQDISGQNAPYMSKNIPYPENKKDLGYDDNLGPIPYGNTKNLPYNIENLTNAQNLAQSEPYSGKNVPFNHENPQNNPYSAQNLPYNLEKVANTQNLARNEPYGTKNTPYNLEKGYRDDNLTQNIPYSAQNLPYNLEKGTNPQNLAQNEPYGVKNLPYNLEKGTNVGVKGYRDDNITQNNPYGTQNMPYNLDKGTSTQNLGYRDNENENMVQNDPYNAQNLPYNVDKSSSIDKNHPENLIQLPLTTSNVEKHQEQFLNNDFPHLSETPYKNRVPIPVFNAENKINPYEFEQNISSVGYIRDIDYNIPKIQDADVINSNAIPTCHKCEKLFNDGSFAVSVDRTESLWHSECFNCHTCGQPLADLLYFYHKDTDNIYCGRDYALLKGIPRCAACDELIFVREYCLAEERTFHIKHFCCFECDEPLAGKQYLMENNQPNCVDCYEKLKAEKCTDCGYVIGPEERGVSLQGLHWHASEKCFACKHCRKGLLGGKMLLRKQNLFCSDICFKTYHA